jgi:hypothetical protein
MLENLEAAMSNELSVATVVINLLCAAGLSILLSWHFNAFASTFSNRKKFGNVLPFIALTTVLVISIVKASLALSLGLVGALSIVRFRTPVKEPEELAYLFLAIALGLGFGADQRIVTIAAVGVILGILTIRSLMTARKWTPNLYLNIDIPPSDQQSKPVVLKEHIASRFTTLRRSSGQFCGDLLRRLRQCRSIERGSRGRSVQLPNSQCYLYRPNRFARRLSNVYP